MPWYVRVSFHTLFILFFALKLLSILLLFRNTTTILNFEFTPPTGLECVDPETVTIANNGNLTCENHPLTFTPSCTTSCEAEWDQVLDGGLITCNPSTAWPELACEEFFCDDPLLARYQVRSFRIFD